MSENKVTFSASVIASLLAENLHNRGITFIHPFRHPWLPPPASFSRAVMGVSPGDKGYIATASARMKWMKFVVNQNLLFYLYFLILYSFLFLFLSTFNNGMKPLMLSNMISLKSSIFKASESSTSTSIPIILEWNEITWKKDAFMQNISCPFKCLFTKNKAKFEGNATIITYHMGDKSLREIPKTPNRDRMNVFINFEPPPHRNFYLKVPKDFFNLTMTYRFDSDFPMPYDCLKELDVDDPDVWDPREVNCIFTFGWTSDGWPEPIKTHFVKKTSIAWNSKKNFRFGF